MDNKIYEYRIIKKAGIEAYSIRAAIVLGILFIAVMGFGFLGVYGLLFLFFAIFFGYKFYAYSKVEYEYRILDNELRVDVIYGESKRKEVGVFDLKKSDLITNADSDEAAYYQKATEMKIFDFLSGYEGKKDNELLIIAGYGASNARVYIEVSDEIKEYLKYRFPMKCKFR